MTKWNGSFSHASKINRNVCSVLRTLPALLANTSRLVYLPPMATQINGSFGAFLREQRSKAGLTLRQVEVDTQGAVSNAYLSQLEGNKRPPPKPAVLIALGKLYGVPTE